jgi:RimJ/RimL family protein N-acetyltransferase
MKTLETDRLTLRPFTMADKIEIHRLVYADPGVAPFWSGRTWALDEITESFAKKLAQPENGLDFHAVELKPTGLLMGLIGFQLYEAGEIEQYMVFENEASRVKDDPEFFQVEITYALGRASGAKAMQRRLAGR